MATLARKLWARDFGSDLLAGISILSSVLLASIWLEPSLC